MALEAGERVGQSTMGTVGQELRFGSASLSRSCKGKRAHDSHVANLHAGASRVWKAMPATLGERLSLPGRF